LAAKLTNATLFVRGLRFYPPQVIDQCLELEFLKRVLLIVRHIDVIDHHASTIKILADLVDWCRSSPETIVLLNKLSYVLNTNASQSGVGMVWADRYPTRPLHWVFRYVQDRDLEQFHLPFAKEVCAALYKTKYQSFDVLEREFPHYYFKEEALERLVSLIHEGRQELIDQERRMDVYVAQAKHTSFKHSTYVALKVKHVQCDEFDIAATLCTRLAGEAGVDVGLVTSRLQGGGKTKVSLRTGRDDLDLNMLASICFPGGGGHKAQAGAMLYDSKHQELRHFCDFE
jgi:hypothetical protein